MKNGPLDQRYTNSSEADADEAETTAAWERIALGHLLLADGAESLIDQLTPDQFQSIAHQYIYATIQAHADQRVDDVGVLRDLLAERRVTAFGDPGLYLSRCRGEAFEAVGDFSWYAARIREAHHKRVGAQVVERARTALRTGDLAGLQQTLSDGAVQLAAAGPACGADQPQERFPSIDWQVAFGMDFSNIDWLLGRFMERGQQVTLVGDGKVGKSLFALDWVYRLVAGKQFMGDGRRAPMKVLYFDRENSLRDVVTRAMAFGATAGDLHPRLSYRQFPAFSGTLDQSSQAARQFLGIVDDDAPDVVVLDTASRFIGGKENDSDTWLQLYQLIHAPMKSRGVACLRLDHFGKDADRGSRGSSAKTQDVDHVWEMKRMGENRTAVDGIERIATTIKMVRTHTRTGLGDDEFVIVRRGEKQVGGMWLPGRTGHEIADVGVVAEIRAEVAAMVDALIAAGVPAGLGRPALVRWMNEQGMSTHKNGLMADVVRELKVRQGH